MLKQMCPQVLKELYAGIPTALAVESVKDTEENVFSLMEFLSLLRGVEEVDLLPFHDVEEKYRYLGVEYKMPIHNSPSRERLIWIKEKLEGLGLYVKVGG
jgi:pyruvate formate lyase activating enzyme